jgi:parallel beta-helix repeat protein
MNDAIRQRLCDLLAQHGPTLVNDPRRCESLVRDFCGTGSREGKILLLTIKEQVPHDLLTQSASDPWPTVLGRLTQKLQQGLAMEADAATWAVESWAIALGMISGVDTSRPGPRKQGGSAETVVGRKTTIPVSTTPPLIVSKLGPEHFHSISEAIQKARPGARILVLPGLYNEEIVLDKALEIVGEGRLADVIVQNTSGSSCLTMRTDYAVVRNLTLRGRAALVGKNVVTVSIPQGRLVLENCDVSSDSDACIYVHGTLANPIIRFCEIHDSVSGSGFFCDKQSEGVIEDCNIHSNTQAQVLIQSGSSCVFRRCHVQKGKSAGVIVRDKGHGTFEDCLIRDNSFSGIEIQSESNPAIYRCEIHSNGMWGLLFGKKSKGLADRCYIHSNGQSQAQVEIREESEPTIRQCKISGGNGVGISIQSKAKGLLEECDIADAAGVGIWIGEESDPTLRRCVIHDGKVNGVVISGRSKGTLANCEIARHLQQYPAVVVMDGSSPLLSRCRVHTCGASGVWIRGKGVGTVLDCEVHDTASAGVEIGEESAPILKNCVVRNSKTTGVLIRGKSTGELKECKILSNAYAGVTVQEGGKPRLSQCIISGNGYEAVWIKADSTATVTECNLSGNKRGAWNIAAGCLVHRTGNYVEGQKFVDVMCEECGEEFEVDGAGPVICPDPACKTSFVIDAEGNVVHGQEQGEGLNEDDDYGELEEDGEDEFDDDELDEPVVITCEECGEEFEHERAGVAICPNEECLARYAVDEEGWAAREEDEADEAAEHDDGGAHLSEMRRKEVFAALVRAQDQGLAIPESRREVTRRFGLSEDELRAIEQEGLDHEWPPL